MRLFLEKLVVKGVKPNGYKVSITLLLKTSQIFHEASVDGRCYYNDCVS